MISLVDSKYLYDPFPFTLDLWALDSNQELSDVALNWLESRKNDWTNESDLWRENKNSPPTLEFDSIFWRLDREKRTLTDDAKSHRNKKSCQKF